MRTLYIDVDGVMNRLDAVKGSSIPWRRDAAAFLKWALQHFECCWLTAWSDESIKERLLPELGLKDHVENFVYPKWGDHKHDGIDFSRPFYWMDDWDTEVDINVLIDRDAMHSFLLVSPIGEDELWRVSSELAHRELFWYGHRIEPFRSASQQFKEAEK